MEGRQLDFAFLEDFQCDPCAYKRMTDEELLELVEAGHGTSGLADELALRLGRTAPPQHVPLLIVAGVLCVVGLITCAVGWAL